MSYPGRSVCLPVEPEAKRGNGQAVEEDQAVRGSVTLEQSEQHATLKPGKRAREAERSTMNRQKSAESVSRQRTATKEEHMEANRNGAFDA
jgi:hypothetical protein